jgi:hypothetical protein
LRHCRWFGNIAEKAQILRRSGRPQSAEKECPDWASWRRERASKQNLSAWNFKHLR